MEGRKERNVLFNDALNTFYLQLYGVGHMVTDHSDSERGNLLLPLNGLLFSISSKEHTWGHCLICITHLPSGTYITALFGLYCQVSTVALFCSIAAWSSMLGRASLLICSWNITRLLIYTYTHITYHIHHIHTTPHHTTRHYMTWHDITLH